MKDAEIISQSPLPTKVKVRDEDVKVSPSRVMDFPDAMREVLNNVKIRRSDWPAGVYGVLKDGMLTLHNDTGDHSWLVSSGDLEGENWETTN
jgi:hypothetical protein